MTGFFYSDSDLVVEVLEGAIISRVISHPERAFAFEVIFHLDHPRMIALGSEKPPVHFHPYQEEYVQVLEGHLALQVEKREIILGVDDEEFRIPPWTNHCLYPPPTKPPSPSRQGNHGESLRDGNETPAITRFLLSGQESMHLLKLDKVFFQNWYAYQDQILLHGKKPDLIQIMSMFDAGGSYISFPTWLPFSRGVARATGILLGRWIGQLLGYQPFYRKWTNDELWPIACQKMESLRFRIKRCT